MNGVFKDGQSRENLLQGQSKMDNPEKLATQDTQHEDKQNKTTTQYVLDNTIRKQTQIRQNIQPCLDTCIQAIYFLDSLFGDDKEDDLFAPKEKPMPSKIEPKPTVDQSEVSSPPKPTIDQSEVSSAPVVKKPPGAVSMFGGMDPFGASKKIEPQSGKGQLFLF